MRTSPAAGSPIGMRVSSSTSGPPNCSMRTALTVVAMLASIVQVAYRLVESPVSCQRSIPASSHAPPYHRSQSGHRHPLVRHGAPGRLRRERAASLRQQHRRRAAARPVPARSVGRRPRACGCRHAARAAAQRTPPPLGVPVVPRARGRTVRAVLELRHGDAGPMTRLGWRTALLMTLPPLLWAGNAVVGRLVVGSVPPLLLNCLRWLLAGLLLAPLGWRVWRDPRAIAVRWKYLLAAGLLGVGTYNSLQYLALVTTTPINVTLIAASMPVWMLLVSA